MAGKEDLGSKVTIRQCTHEDFVAMVKVSNEVEHWNESLVDLELLGRCFPGGSFAALLEGKPVGFTMGFNWSEREAFGGMSVVLPEYRGRGIGTALWAERRKYVGDRNFGIMSVPERIEPNGRIGFNVKSAETGIYEGKLDLSKLEAPSKQYGIQVHDVGDLFNEVVAYDADIYPICSRASYLKEWFQKEKTKTLVAVNDGNVVGYGCVQPAGEGYYVTPLYADTKNIAELLLHGMLSSLSANVRIAMHLPFDNKAAVAMAERFGLCMVIGLVTMHTRYAHKEGWQKVFGCSKPEMCHV
ncbi:uncharacterized protein F36G3.2-like [Lineus longissimus]|uniref:uncharacterized protein F36G3.2-like n=1 Tax=Lineus longissimus TaxID=88925 RepID=UPI002B4C5B07